MAEKGGGFSFGYGAEEEEEVDVDFMISRDDAEWKLIQKNTFTRWCNEHLKGATGVKEIESLDTDLANGLVLIKLIEGLSFKKFPKYNKRPTMRVAMLENVTQSLKFLEVKEKVHIVNIDSADIVGGKSKLIMGLIWALILHYSVSMQFPDDEDDDDNLTPKSRLLAWIQRKIPEKNIRGFTGDWNDGTAIGALVDALAPGLCPDWDTWEPKDRKANAKKAMELAAEWLDCPMLIRPMDMTNPKIDDLSMITYLSQFPKAKLKPGAPLKPKLNPDRCRAWGPGLEAAGNAVNSQARFTIETLRAGPGKPEVVINGPKGKVECIVRENNDVMKSYSCSYTPTVEGKYTVTITFASKPIPMSPFTVEIGTPQGDASKCSALGPGIRKTGVSMTKQTFFNVNAKTAGIGVVDVAIVDPEGKRTTVIPTVSKKAEGEWNVKYRPKVQGMHYVYVFFAGKAIPNSPFTVGVGKDRQPFKGAAAAPKEATPAVEAALSSRAPKMVKLPVAEAPIDAVKAKGVAAAPAAPPKPAFDASKVYATGRGLQATGVRVKDRAEFTIHTTKDSGEAEIKITIVDASGKELKVESRKIDQFTTECFYIPTAPGVYTITITFGGANIQKAPFKVEIGPTKESKVKAYGPGLEGGVVGMLATFTVELKGEKGTLDFNITGPSEPKVERVDREDGSVFVSYTPNQAGEYAVHILCDKEDIPNSPYMAGIIPDRGQFFPSKVTASGPGLEKTGVTVNKYAEFTIDTRQAGTAPVKVQCLDVDCNPIDVIMKDNENGTYSCKYMPKLNTKHTVMIMFGGVSIGNSPFTIEVQEAANPAMVKVSGPAVDKPVKTYEATYIDIDYSKAGPGEASVTMTDEEGMEVPTKKTVDEEKKTIRVDFEPTTVGTKTTRVIFAGQEIPKSPFKIDVKPSIDVSKIKINGLKDKFTMGEEISFDIVTTGAGKGQAQVTILSATGKTTPATIEETKDGYKVKFTCSETGDFTVDIKFADQPVPNSPFKFTSEEPAKPKVEEDLSHKVKAYGPGLKDGTANTPAEFTVDAREAGKGGLGFDFKGPKDTKDPKVETFTKEDGTMGVKFFPKEPGEYTLTILFGGKPIPNSPFKSYIAPGQVTDVSGVKCTGPGLEPSGVFMDSTTEFTVDAKSVTTTGEGKVLAFLTGPSGTRVEAFVESNKDGTYKVNYAPTEKGAYKIDVSYEGIKLPQSPIEVKAIPGCDPSKVKVSGPGLEKGITGKPNFFTVETAGAGQGELTFDFKGPSEPKVEKKSNPDGSTNVEYFPIDKGDYQFAVKWGGKDVPGSPFKVGVVEQNPFDPSKVLVTGDGVNPEGNKASLPVSFTVDCKQAGKGKLAVNIQNPEGRDEKPKVKDNKDGTYTISYTPDDVGFYSVDVKYGGEMVPGAPFDVEMVPAGDASKVRVPENFPKVIAVNEDNVIPLNVSEAGEGNITCKISSTASLKEVDHEIIDHGDGKMGIKFKPDVPGTYTSDIKFGGVPIPAAPLEQEAEVPSLYEAVEFDIPAGPIFENVAATVTSPSGKKEPVRIQDNEDGTVKIKFRPTEPGTQTLDLNYENKPTQGSPFKIHTDPKDAEYVKASGAGLSHGIVNEPCSFIVDVSKGGAGGLGLAMEGPVPATMQAKDNMDGTFTVTFLPTGPGKFVIPIKWGGKEISGSPFTSSVVDAPANKPTTIEPKCPEVPITVEENMLASMYAIVKFPSGVEKRCRLRRTSTGKLGVSFEYSEVGVHLVTVYQQGQPLGPAFEVPVEEMMIIDSSKVEVTGKGVETTEVQAESTSEFTVNAKSAGWAALSIFVVGPAKPEVKVIDNKDGTFKIAYKVTVPGNYIIMVKFNGVPIPGSPFLITVKGKPGKVDEETIAAEKAGSATKGFKKIMLQGRATDAPDVGTECKLNLIIPKTKLSDMEASVTNPSGNTEQSELKEVAEGKYQISFVSKEAGIHNINMKHRGMPIPGSPFQMTIGGAMEEGGAHKVKAAGSGLMRGRVNEKCEFNMMVQEAGAGSVHFSMEGPSAPNIEAQPREDGSVGVSYSASEPGEYNLGITFNDQHIPDSPFKVHIAPAAGESDKVSVVNIQRQHLQMNQDSTFTVDFNGAEGELDAKVVAPSGAVDEAFFQEVETGKYTVTFSPRENGIHFIHVKLSGNHIPGSPFRVMVGEQEGDVGKVRAYGEGLEEGEAGKVCRFIVNTENAGPGAINVTIEGPSKVTLNYRKVAEGYEFTYTAKVAGEYLVIIKYAGENHISGSPFKVIMEGKETAPPGSYGKSNVIIRPFVRQKSAISDATKVVCSGAGLNKAVLNQETNFSVDCASAGQNMLWVGVQGPVVPCEAIHVLHKGKLQYDVSYKLSQAGEYVLGVKWGDQHVPGSPYTIRA